MENAKFDFKPFNPFGLTFLQNESSVTSVVNDSFIWLSGLKIPQIENLKMPFLQNEDFRFKNPSFGFVPYKTNPFGEC
jgi:hypothetical protein